MSTKVVASWTRVSSDEQAERGSSLPEQREDNASTIARHALTGPVRQYGNTDESALGEKPRPQFEALVRDIEGERVSAVVAKNWQRISRNSSDFLNFWEACKVAGCDLYVSGSPVNLRDGATRLGALVQVEGSSIDTKIRLDASAKGRIRLASMGLPSSGGTPFGRFVPAVLSGTRRAWKLDDKGKPDWRIVEGADKYVQRLAREYLRSSSWEVAVENVGPWHEDRPSSLAHRANTARRRVLEAGADWVQDFALRDNPAEAIQSLSNADRISIKDGRAYVVTPVPALLDADTLAKVKAKADQHYSHHRSRRGADGEPLHDKEALQGFLRCGNCGSVLNVRHHREKGGVVARVSHGPGAREGCSASFVQYAPIELSVLGGLTSMLRDEKALRAALKQATEALVPEAAELRDELDTVRKAIKKTERQLEDMRQNLLRRLGDEEAAWLNDQLKSIKGTLAQQSAREAELGERMRLISTAPAHLREVERVLGEFIYKPRAPSLIQSSRAVQRETMQALFGAGTLRRRPDNAKQGSPETGVFLRWVEDAGERFVQWRAIGNLFMLDGNTSQDDVGYSTEVRDIYESLHGYTRARWCAARWR